MAIKIQQENRRLTTVLETTGKLKSSPKHWGKWVQVLVDWSLVLLASSDMLGLFVSSMWGRIMTRLPGMILWVSSP